MYPNLYYFFKDVFGLDFKPLMVVNTFGLFVALAFIIGAWLLHKELKRKEKLGYFTYTDRKIVVGKPATTGELLSNFLIGFLFGYKILGVMLSKEALADPQSYIFSSQGSWLSGLALGALFTYLKWKDKDKVKLAKPEEKTIRIWPSDRLSDIVIIAAVAGFLGAKIFDNLEHFDTFIQDPIGNLFSASGLTFYGGLITAIICLWIYFRKNKMPFINVADAAAPALMMSYGIGRLGCQVSGDGDWGIINSAYISNTDGSVLSATPAQFNAAVDTYRNVTEQFGIIGEVQHAAFTAPSWLPDWTVAYTFPHNVNKEGIPLANCTWNDFCNYLPLPVFPTSLYEIIMCCLILFPILWLLRKKFVTPGKLFGLYLIFNGVERYLIEKIRVNTKYDIFGWQPSQAELISLGMMIAGIALLVFAKKWFVKATPENVKVTSK